MERHRIPLDVSKIVANQSGLVARRLVVADDGFGVVEIIEVRGSIVVGLPLALCGGGTVELRV